MQLWLKAFKNVYGVKSQQARSVRQSVLGCAVTSHLRVRVCAQMNDIYKRMWNILHTHVDFRDMTESIMARATHECTGDLEVCKTWEPTEVEVRCFKNLVRRGRALALCGLARASAHRRDAVHSATA
jgi:hypothetical protein